MSRSSSTNFALTPFDGKCHFFIFADVLPLITSVTDGQSGRQTGEDADMDRETDKSIAIDFLAN